MPDTPLPPAVNATVILIRKISTSTKATEQERRDFTVLADALAAEVAALQREIGDLRGELAYQRDLNDALDE